MHSPTTSRAASRHQSGESSSGPSKMAPNTLKMRFQALNDRFLLEIGIFPLFSALGGVTYFWLNQKAFHAKQAELI
jgi:hypothetical protein